MKKTVMLTVVATMFVELLVVFLIVLWNSGGSFGPMIRKIDYLQRISNLYDVGVISTSSVNATPNEFKRQKNKKGDEATDPNWKLADQMEFGPWKENVRWITKGDKATVPNWEWVEVKNPDPINNGNATFNYNDTCGIERGGIVTSMGAEEDLILVRYSIRGAAYGTQCPNGTLFFLTERRFSRMTSEYNEVIAAEKKERNHIKKLLGK